MTRLSMISSAAALALLTANSPAAAEQIEGECPTFETAGEGPDLLLVPGLGSAPAVWDNVRDRLSETHRVHFIHVAGFAGRAANGDPGTIIDRSIAEIIAYLDCEGIESTAYAGHSMGGFMGLKMAVEHRTRIDRLVVVDALPFFPLIFSPDATVDTVQSQADSMRTQILALDDDSFEQGQRSGVRTFSQNADYHPVIVEWSLTSDRATFAGAMHSIMTSDMRPLLAQIDTPTTVIAASNAFVPTARVEALYNPAYANLSGVELQVVEDSFHFIMFDQPEAFGEALQAALTDE